MPSTIVSNSEILPLPVYFGGNLSFYKELSYLLVHLTTYNQTDN